MDDRLSRHGRFLQFAKFELLIVKGLCETTLFLGGECVVMCIYASFGYRDIC